MSKIGKINISIPEKVKVALAGNNLNIEGPLGKTSLDIDLEMFNLDIKDGKEISIKPKKIDQDTLVGLALIFVTMATMFLWIIYFFFKIFE